MKQSQTGGVASPARSGDSPILVTGAAGKTGQAIIGALVARGASVRALVCLPEQAAHMRELGVADIVIGDIQVAEQRLPG